MGSQRVIAYESLYHPSGDFAARHRVPNCPSLPSSCSRIAVLSSHPENCLNSRRCILTQVEPGQVNSNQSENHEPCTTIDPKEGIHIYPHIYITKLVRAGPILSTLQIFFLIPSLLVCLGLPRSELLEGGVIIERRREKKGGIFFNSDGVPCHAD